MGTTQLSAEFCTNNDGPSSAILKLINAGSQIYYNASFPWNGNRGSLSGLTLTGIANNVTISAAINSNGTTIDINITGTALGYGAGTLSGSVSISASGVSCTSA